MPDAGDGNTAGSFMIDLENNVIPVELFVGKDISINGMNSLPMGDQFRITAIDRDTGVINFAPDFSRVIVTTDSINVLPVESRLFTRTDETEFSIRSVVTVRNPGVATRSQINICLLYTSPSPRDATLSRMPSSA